MPMHHGRSLTVENAYYVDATNGNDSNSGRTPSAPWRTLNKVNFSVFNPGDRILLKRGELWRETLVVASSGTAAQPIEVTAYGTGTNPTICGADISALSWSVFSGNVWQATYSTDPGFLRVDGTPGTQQASAGACVAQYDWFWDGANTLYLFSTTSPGGKTVEIAVRPFSVVVGKNFQTYTGLTVEMSVGFGNIAIANGATNATVRYCESRYGGQLTTPGIIIYTNAGAPHLIERNTVYQCSHGVLGYIHTAASAGNEVVVRANECYSNVVSGIMCRANWWIIEENSVHDNGSTVPPAVVGIWVLTASLVEGAGTHNIIRYNRVWNTTQGPGFDGGGIATDQWCDNNDIYGNLVFANRSYGINILDNQFNNIYNNTCYGNSTEILIPTGEVTILSSAAPDNRTSDVNVKNNIGYSTQAFSVAAFIDANTTGNANIVFDNNIWFGTSTNWWTAGATNGTSLVTWNAFTWVTTDINSDPLLTNPGSDDLTLQSGSPAKNTGLNLGTTYQFDLNPGATWPGCVVTANQSLFGADWEIGAYVVLT